ncbi:MAG: flagellar export chaperone FliS [Acidobacteria bacterium]|nr:flagellar export chaperone FliS [Acidobacteriota bacterium]
MNYQQQSLQSATGVELIVALYDGAIRFLHRAIRAVEEDDVIERRFAVKRAIDIIIYLQACLRTNMGGGEVAHSLADFYDAMFQRTLEASHDNSAEGLLEVIACLRNVRDAWTIVARDPQANGVMPRDMRLSSDTTAQPMAFAAPTPKTEAGNARWSA